MSKHRSVALTAENGIETEVNLTFTDVGTIELEGTMQVPPDQTALTWPVCRRLYFATVNVEGGQLTATLQPFDGPSQEFLHAALKRE